MTSEESGLLGEIKTEFVEDFEIQDLVSEQEARSLLDATCGGRAATTYTE